MARILVGAQHFWRATIDAYTGGEFETHDLNDERWKGPVLTFGAPGSAVS